MKKQAAGSEKAFFSKSGTSCNIQVSMIFFHFQAKMYKASKWGDYYSCHTNNTIIPEIIFEISSK